MIFPHVKHILYKTIGDDLLSVRPNETYYETMHRNLMQERRKKIEHLMNIIKEKNETRKNH
jgi:hypothetical protein